MKTEHFNFSRSNKYYEVKITLDWFLGFTAGVGSFFIEDIKGVSTPTFSVGKTGGVDSVVIFNIKEFLGNYFVFCSYSSWKFKKDATIISINTGNVKRSYLKINNIQSIHNFLIPLFSDAFSDVFSDPFSHAFSHAEFLTNIGKDFNDFKIISKAIYEGALLKADTALLIKKIVKYYE